MAPFLFSTPIPFSPRWSQKRRGPKTHLLDICHSQPCTGCISPSLRPASFAVPSVRTATNTVAKCPRTDVYDLSLRSAKRTFGVDALCLVHSGDNCLLGCIPERGSGGRRFKSDRPDRDASALTPWSAHCHHGNSLCYHCLALLMGAPAVHGDGRESCEWWSIGVVFRSNWAYMPET